MTFDLSVCTLTRNRWYMYPETLIGNLKRIGLPRDKFEFIIWDNASDVETTQWLKSHSNYFDKIIFSKENHWKYAAVEVVREAKANKIIFFDDDMFIPFENWWKYSLVYDEILKKEPRLWGIYSVTFELNPDWRFMHWDEREALKRFKEKNLPWKLCQGVKRNWKVNSYPGWINLTNGFYGQFWVTAKNRVNFDFQAMIPKANDLFAPKAIAKHGYVVGRFLADAGAPCHLGRSTKQLFNKEEIVKGANEKLKELIDE